MTLLPTSPRGWVLGVARPLFLGCVFVLALVAFGTFFGGIYWRYARSSVGYELLPALGLLQALSCIPFNGLSRSFRILSGIVAAASVSYGFVAPILETAY